jgi:rhomboid protease GluP
MLGGFVCPWCRHYNATDSERCERCQQRLPPVALAKPLAEVLGIDLWATKLLVGINAVIFAAQLAMTLSQKGDFITSMPSSVLMRFGALTNGLESAEPFRLLAACFVHIGVLHIAFNMMALLQLGRVGESAVGGARLLVTYVVTGIVGFVASGYWYRYGEHNQPYITAGASGAIFGVSGLLIAMLAMRGDKRWKEILIQQLFYSFILWKALNTNQAAHMAGLVVGGLFGVFFARESRPWRLAIVVNGLAALSLLATGISLYLPHRSPIWREVRAQEVRRQERIEYRERAIPMHDHDGAAPEE